MSLHPALQFLLAVALLYAGIRWFEWSQTFHPSKRMEPMEPGYPEYEEIEFVAEDGVRLTGWWFANPEARGTVIYCHGNAGNISTRPDVYAGLHGLGLNVFAFDYRGYGKSRGIPSEKGLYRDARAAYEVVRAKHGDADEPPVIVYGASLGGAPATQLASEKPVRGLIIEGGFTSSRDVAALWYPWLPLRYVLHYKMDSEARLRELDTPLLVAHSRIDQVIPFELGEKLFGAAAGPKKFIRLAGEHGEAGWNDTPEYLNALRQFVAEVL